MNGFWDVARIHMRRRMESTRVVHGTMTFRVVNAKVVGKIPWPIVESECERKMTWKWDTPTYIPIRLGTNISSILTVAS